MKKYLVTVEFRYLDDPSYGFSEYKTKNVTLGVYDDFDAACAAGNNILENLESKFSIHTFPTGQQANKERFSKNGGCFNSKKTLVSNLAYLKTPFYFCAKITTLDYLDIDETVSEILCARKRWKAYKEKIDTE